MAWWWIPIVLLFGIIVGLIVGAVFADAKRQDEQMQKRG